jgi:hypothetical protein
MRMSLLFSLLLWATACGFEPGLQGTRIKDARFSVGEVSSAGLMGHRTTGRGTIIATAEDGSEVRAPLLFEGGGIGATMGVLNNADCGDVPFDLSRAQDADGLVGGEQLFGYYDGAAVGMALVAGFAEHRLGNDAGIEIEITGLAFGAFMLGGAEWIAFSLGRGDGTE